MGVEYHIVHVEAAGLFHFTLSCTVSMQRLNRKLNSTVLYQ